ncbi:MAG TPA: D-alanyl-D-alanine carboxypeptidase/D-alanyl-D-alanine-endopeptidase [Acidimicrobiia bacterium]|nr:D-alanyl-D-alanine carboxypeptidase/D-alanyl-D-alanine-endopeptidase [Acidimicrobiia bacterium]
MRRVVGYFAAFVCLCVAGAIVFAVAPRARPVVAAQPPQPNARTAVWSLRRVPALLGVPVAGARLTVSLRAALAGTESCVSVVSAGGVRANVAPNDPQIPASTIKLLTAIAALRTFGPDHRFTTRVFQGAAPRQIIVVGGGDPLLATPAYEAALHTAPRWHNAPVLLISHLADAIRNAGVRAVSSIIVDDTRHEAVRYLPQWKAGYGDTGDIGALGALTVDGGFADPTLRKPADDPALLTGTRLAEALRSAGVAVTGGIAHGLVPEGAREIAHLDSLPLGAMIGEMITASDDGIAEMLLREIGVARAHEGTTAAGARAEVDIMRELSVPTAGMVVLDGSGLARGDRLTCDALLHIVQLITTKPFAILNGALPIAGATGTLTGRFLGDALAGKLRAKTGTLSNVAGLAGVIDLGSRPRFAMLLSGAFSRAGGEELENSVVHRIAAAPAPGPAAAAVPRP